MSALSAVIGGVAVLLVLTVLVTGAAFVVVVVMSIEIGCPIFGRRP